MGLYDVKNVSTPLRGRETTRGDAQRGEMDARALGRAQLEKKSATALVPRLYDNDPSAGSPTETLLRLLLPLNDQV